VEYFFINANNTLFINNIKEAGAIFHKALSSPMIVEKPPLLVSGPPKVGIDLAPENINLKQKKLDEIELKKKALKREEEEVKKLIVTTAPNDYSKILEPLRVKSLNMETSGNIYLQTAKGGLLNPLGGVRLAREIQSMAKDLPCYSSNSAFVRVDSTRNDLMKVMIMGSEDTPYAHGAFEFDFFSGLNYPNQPPKMTLLTTGSSQVRFNPNLYNNGYVCLSLLGTWSGHGSENWTPNSTVLQLIISIQSLVMNEDIYYNEPSFEKSKGSPAARSLNTAYSNIVKYCNVRFAMIDQIKKPPQGFEEVVKAHFSLKKEAILKTVQKWVQDADKEPAEYTGLVASHNSQWCTFFENNNATFKAKLKLAYDELEKVLNAM
jgi:ubiquitin-protein ligase